MATTTNYNWNIFTKGQKPYWDEWVTLLGNIDTELYKRSKDLYMQGKVVYGSEAIGGNLLLKSTPHATKGKIYFGENAYWNELSDVFTLPIEKGIIFQTQPTWAVGHNAGPFSITNISAIYNAVRCNSLIIGYNQVPGTDNTKVVSTEPLLQLKLHANFNDGAGKQYLEWEWDYLSADNSQSRRPLGYGVEINTHIQNWVFAVDTVNFESSDYKNAVVLTMGSDNVVDMYATNGQTVKLQNWKNYSGVLQASIGVAGQASFPELSSPNGVLIIPNTNLRFYYTMGAANEKYWSIDITATKMLFRMWNDALGAAADWCSVTRSAADCPSVNFYASAITLSRAGSVLVAGGTSVLGVGGGGLQVQDTSPAIVLQQTNASANNKVWTAFEVWGGALHGRVLNDALNAAQDWITVTRSGATVTSIAFPHGFIDIGAGVIKVASTQVVGARVVDARIDDAINSGDATTDGVIDALRDAMITHGLIAAA